MRRVGESAIVSTLPLSCFLLSSHGTLGLFFHITKKAPPLLLWINQIHYVEEKSGAGLRCMRTLHRRGAVVKLQCGLTALTGKNNDRKPQFTENTTFEGQRWKHSSDGAERPSAWWCVHTSARSVWCRGDEWAEDAEQSVLEQTQTNITNSCVIFSSSVVTLAGR